MAVWMFKALWNIEEHDQEKREIGKPKSAREADLENEERLPESLGCGPVGDGH
jgi:hypothetical protein